MKKAIQYCTLIALMLIGLNAFGQGGKGEKLTFDAQIIGGHNFCGQGTLYVATTGGIPPYNYSWSDGSTADSLIVTITSSYSVTLTDGIGSIAVGHRYVNFETLDVNITCLTEFCGATELIASLPDVSQSGNRYYIQNSNPFGNTCNNVAMDANFGAGNWIQETYSASPATIFSPSTQFVFMEGSDTNAIAMNNFVTTNIILIENWVKSGGRLFMNASPTQGVDMNWGFGGVKLNYNHPQTHVAITFPIHPIDMGPFIPSFYTCMGNNFSNGHITGGCTYSLLEGNGYVVAAESTWGAGDVIFAGMTTTNWHNSQIESQNFRQNIIYYLLYNGIHINSYLWSDGSTTKTITATTSGTYSVTVSYGGCTATATSTIVINPLPTTPSIAQNGGDLTTGVYNAYQWYLNGNILNGATSQTYTPTQDGDHTVVVTDALGCTTTSTTYPVNFTSTGQLQQDNIRLYPNPATHVAIVEGLLPNSQLTLFDGLGQRVWVGEASSRSLHIPLDGLASGIYYVRVSQGGEVIVLRLEKE